MSRQQFCTMSAMMSAEALTQMTLSIGPLLPLPDNKADSSAVSLGDSDAVMSSCNKDATVVIEGVGIVIVVVIAFAAFAIGVMLMSSLWFIYVKTSKLHALFSFSVILSQ